MDKRGRSDCKPPCTVALELTTVAEGVPISFPAELKIHVTCNTEEGSSTSRLCNKKEKVPTPALKPCLPQRPKADNSRTRCSNPCSEISSFYMWLVVSPHGWRGPASGCFILSFYAPETRMLRWICGCDSQCLSGDAFRAHISMFWVCLRCKEA